MERASEYEKRRAELHERMLARADLPMKRFLAVDHDVYTGGALPGAVKELMGLVASTVLRCNDCIDYHLLEAVRAGVSDAEIIEALDIALVVGGSITIPHIRHALAFLETIEREDPSITPARHEEP
jgi:AhpD family alkylhydroperoxidase